MGKTLAQHLKDVMVETGAKRIWKGHMDICHEAYERFGGKVVHPLNKIKAVMDAARRSDLFVQQGYIRACDSSGRREILHPAFVLRPEE